jgi:TatD DNase family protein
MMASERFGFVDVHCHVDLFEDPRRIVEEADTHSVHTIAVTNAPSVYPHTESLARGSQFVRPAVGLHPELAAARGRELELMWQMLNRTRWVGEVGLDYRVGDALSQQRQRKVFEEILAHCAQYGDKILSVHSRRAAGDVVSAIGPNFSGTVILHWYSGGFRDLARAVEYGFYFSVNSAMVASRKGQNLIERIPRDRVLTESDGPFLQMGDQPATPGCMLRIVERLGDLWGLSPEETRRQVEENFQNLLGENSSGSL